MASLLERQLAAAAATAALITLKAFRLHIFAFEHTITSRLKPS